MVSIMELSPWLGRFESEWLAVQDRLYPASTTLHAACRYALAGQGKRIRPLLAMAAAEAVGAGWDKALPAAVAVEFIHSYSLVHDDLPCMDDDDLRRGRATTHKVYDEATALLVGDALLTDAFQVLLSSAVPPAILVAMVRTLSEAAGGRGMVYGQALDMHWTGRTGFSAADLDTIHRNKTGALIAASCALGGLAGNASADAVLNLTTFGAKLGLAFQIIDDLLDNSAATGKSQGKDAESGKLTYLTLMSRDAAHDRAERLTEEALQELKPFGDLGAALRTLAHTLLQRTH